MLDYHTLKTQVKGSLLRQWQQTEVATDSLIWTWIVHVFAAESVVNNPLLTEALEEGRRWVDSDEAWISDAYLGNIGLLCSVLRQVEDEAWEPAATKLDGRIRHLHNMGLSKFSRLNDPDYVFGIALGVGDWFADDIRKWLRQHCERNAHPGNWRRGLLFAAAAYELGGKVSSFVISGAGLEVHELFPALWFVGRYPQLVNGEEGRRGAWEAFERIKEGVGFESGVGNGGTLYPASPVDLAMLYEALLHETREIDPVVLFNNIPWHHEIRQVAQSLFIKGEYVMAVFQASIVFIDAVKRRANYPTAKGGKQLDGVDLITHVFRLNSPILKFNDLKTLTDRNEHRGLACIAEGTVSAVRNPKGHVPKTAISLSPYEALEQLAIISYLMRRLDSAQT